jgi:drug/metabolite transporter superfamily protein YnfA
MKKLIVALVATVAALSTLHVQAHGSGTARHGGIVVAASDLVFELVAKAETVTVYIDDHGKPLATAGAAGKLTVLNGAQKSEFSLVPAGENRLEAKGAKVAGGAKLVAAITLPGKKVVTVRFTVK